MATPASSPLPMFRLRSELSTSKPSPPAPIIEAMITMLRESMITWFTPTISGARAAGIITRKMSCRFVHPAIRPNSTISGETASSASIVTRTIGGMAYMMVATSAEIGPNPNRNRIGSR